MEWSKQQEAIFEWFANPEGRSSALVIRARAGTGKTTTIIEGINRAPEQSIMLSAFNKNIAAELQSRLRNPFAEAKTLHALGLSIVRRYWNKTNVDTNRGFRLAERAAGAQAPDPMLSLIAKLASKAKEMMPLAADPFSLIPLAEEFDCIPDEEWEPDGWNTERVAVGAFKAMELARQADGTIDYADMLYLPIANRWLHGRYSLVVIDEAQDMNTSQIILAQRSIKDGGRIAVVGDDRQAIYGFRGADSQSIDRLKTELQAEELSLNTTYRCPKVIVTHAQRIVPDYNAAESAPEGQVSAMSIEDAIAAAQPGDFLLSRKNAPLVGVCLKILRANKRARLQGRDIGAGLTALVNKWKSKSMPDFLTRLANWETREIVRANASGSKTTEARVEKIHDQADTLRALCEGLTGVPELRTRIESLFADTGAPAVVCSSIHRVKGLEADRVFILQSTLRADADPACTCNHWPHPGKACGRCACQSYTPDESKRIEERNLEYVAVTRGKHHLVWITGTF